MFKLLGSLIATMIASYWWFMIVFSTSIFSFITNIFGTILTTIILLTCYERRNFYVPIFMLGFMIYRIYGN